MCMNALLTFKSFSEPPCMCNVRHEVASFVSSLASRPSYFRSAGCIASPARGKEGLETLARFSCALEEFA